MKVMLHPKSYSEKPTNPGLLKNELLRYGREVTAPELAKAIMRGQTFIPAELVGEGAASEEHWRSQEVFPVDIDNDRTPYLTVEEAIQKCTAAGLMPSFIYATFSNQVDHPRFRLVFISNTRVTDASERRRIYYGLFEMLGSEHCDVKCVDGARIFYGGTSLLYAEYGNIIDVNAIKCSADKALTPVRTIGPQDLIYTNTKSWGVEVLQAIKYSNSKALQALYPTSYEVHSHAELIDTLQHLDIGTSFICPLHDDHDPSMKVLVLKDGRRIYKCFGCDFTGDLITLTERLQHVSRMKAIAFLMKAFNITKDDRWAQEKALDLTENMRIVYNEFAELAPTAHGILWRYPVVIQTLHEAARQNIWSEEYVDAQGNPVFYISLRELARRMDKYDTKRLSRILGVMSYFGLINKIPDDKVPERLRKSTRLAKARQGEERSIQFYSIPAYGYWMMQDVEARAKVFKANGMTVRSFSRDAILRVDGELTADAVFPKLQGTPQSATADALRDALVPIIMRRIKRRGYVTEMELLSELKGNASTMALRLKRVIPEILMDYCLVRTRATKDLKEQLHIKGKGYPIIIKAE